MEPGTAGALADAGAEVVGNGSATGEEVDAYLGDLLGEDGIGEGGY